jgi:hypothetical protein
MEVVYCERVRKSARDSLRDNDNLDIDAARCA